MGKIRWYKRDPDAALAGMMHLTLEERGAYNTVLDLIYSRDGAVPDDDRFIAGWMRADLRVWRRIRAKLLEEGKLYLADGTLRNCRADEEVLSALDRIEGASQAGKASAAKRGAAASKNNRMKATGAATGVEPTTSTTTFLPPNPRKRGLASQSVSDSEEERWRARLAIYKPGGFWLDSWGERPETGRNASIPKQLLADWLVRFSVATPDNLRRTA